MSMKNYNDTKENRTRDLSAFNAVPQGTVPPRVPTHTHTHTHTHVIHVTGPVPIVSICCDVTHRQTDRHKQYPNTNYTTQIIIRISLPVV